MATAIELRNEALEALGRAQKARDEGDKEHFPALWEDYQGKDKAASEAHEEEAALKAAQEKYDWKPSDVRNPTDALIQMQAADKANSGVRLADGRVVPFADEKTEGWIKGYPASVQHPKIIRALGGELRAAADQENEVFAKWFRWGPRALTTDEHKVMARLKDTEVKTLTEGTGSAGGFLVPTDQRRELVLESGVGGGRVRGISTRLQTTRDSGTLPATNDATTWIPVAEEAAFAESNPTLSEVAFTIRKIGRLNKVSNELLDDSATDIPTLLNLLLGRSLGRYEDQQAIEGDGTTEPAGLPTAGLAQGTIPDAVFPTAVATEPTAADILFAFFALPEQFRDNATWFTTSSFLAKIMGIGAAAAGIHATELLTASPITQLLGRPYILFDGTGWDDAAAIAVNEELGAIGDFSFYYFIDRIGLTVTRLDERFADTDQVGFRFKVRYDSFFGADTPFRILKAAAA